MNKKELATEVAKRQTEEAEAIESYSSLICLIKESKDDTIEDKEELLSIFEEIIADELNHIKKLTKIFEALTKISANKE